MYHCLALVRLMVFGLGLLAVIPSAWAQTVVTETYPSTDVPVDIPTRVGFGVPGIAESDLIIAGYRRIDAISVTLDIAHFFPDDLAVDLITPDGTSVRLHNQTVSIMPTYTTELAVLIGGQIAGTWRLRVASLSRSQSGTINSWSITITSSDLSVQRYSLGITIPDLILPATLAGTAPFIYSIVESLPNGLSFDPATRTLSGTPTTTQNVTTYTYRERNAEGDVSDLAFTIEIIDELAATDLTDDLYRDPGTPDTPTVTINFNDLINDDATADADLEVTMPFADPGVVLVRGGIVADNLLTLDRTKMLEVSGVANTPVAVHTFTYTVTDEDDNETTAILTLRIDERPSISVADREFTVSDRTIGFGRNPRNISFSSLVTSSHTPHGEVVGVRTLPTAPANTRVNPSRSSDGFFSSLVYRFDAGFAGRGSTQFTIGVYATAESIAAAIIPPRHEDGTLVSAGDLIVSDTATFTFIIPNTVIPNTAPVITPPGVPAYLPDETISLIFTADDEDGHPVTFSLADGAGAVPTGAIITPPTPQTVLPATATLTWTTPATAGTFPSTSSPIWSGGK